MVSPLLEKRGIVRDQIHGFIEINNLEYSLLQTPFLRRLHNVKQLGLANLVFPGATHTRFNHSLGVMHISSQIADRLLQIARRGAYCGRIFLHCDRGTEQFLETARLAGLLHDIGHPPLSHQMEESLKTIARARSLRTNEPSPYTKVIARYGGGKLHEAFTRRFISRIVEHLEDRGEYEKALYVRAAGAVLGAYSPAELENVGLSPDSVTVFLDIISNEIFDADRLDYLVRDATMSGVVFGEIDIDRLLVGLQLDLDGEGNIRIGVHPRSLQTLEDVFDARYKMYRTIYYHHKAIAINIAITRVVDILIDNWNDVAPKSLLDNLKGPEDLYNPEAIADVILEGKTLYTDSDFDSILYNMSASKNPQHSRWAHSLLHERSLLPISLVKRPESLVIRIAERVARDHSRKSSLETVSEIYRIVGDAASKKRGVFEKALADRIYSALRGRIPGLNPEDLTIELDTRLIISNNLKSVSEAYRSLYLYFISQIGKLSLVFTYVYSDDREKHLALYRERNTLRKVYEDFVADLVVEHTR
ncbi:MAG: HD domain-containing protein [Desulfurococcales archaeon]|nr:HD domain-containing protein [Desulfurococcales archaeon]